MKNKIRQYRVTMGITQKMLAGWAGCSQEQISEWENNKAEPSWDAICRVADALGVKVDDLRDDAYA